MSQLTINFGFNDNYESFVAQGVVENNPELDSLTFVVQQTEDENLTRALKELNIEKSTSSPHTEPFDVID